MLDALEQRSGKEFLDVRVSIDGSRELCVSLRIYCVSFRLLEASCVNVGAGQVTREEEIALIPSKDWLRVVGLLYPRFDSFLSIQRTITTEHRESVANSIRKSLEMSKRFTWMEALDARDGVRSATTVTFEGRV
jgi:hypothetical protein